MPKINNHHISLSHIGLALACLMLSSHPALAALPIVTPPNGGAVNSSYLNSFQGYARDAAVVLGLLLSAGGLFWIASHVLQDLHEVRTGRKEIGQLAVGIVSGGAVLLLVVFLATQASNII
ncbi:MAG: TIGR03745 family integrating conjugative element membrane protein [Candidatus Paceibacterota bacterium]